MNYIHLSVLHKVIEKGEFSLRFVDEEGNIIYAPRCICTSFHSSGKTLNIKLLISGVIRTVRRCTITEYNDQEVAI